MKHVHEVRVANLSKSVPNIILSSEVDAGRYIDIQKTLNSTCI